MTLAFFHRSARKYHRDTRAIQGRLGTTATDNTMQPDTASKFFKITETKPVFEHVMTEPSKSFLWRLDDYPWGRNVWNFHPEYEIHLIRNASGVALVGDHIGPFEPGYLAVVGSGLPHDWVTDTAPGELIVGRDIVLQFDPEQIRSAAATLPELLEIDPFMTRALRGVSFHGETRRRGAELLEEMGLVDGLERLTMFMRLLNVLAVSKEYVVLSSEGFVPHLDPSTLDIIQRALAYVLDNFTTDINLPDLAAVSGMSDSAFSRFFKKNTGNSFTDHIAKLRVNRACKLLADSNLSITDICFEVGYSNVSNFNRIFLNQRKMTPSSYRRLAHRRRASHPATFLASAT